MNYNCCMYDQFTQCLHDCENCTRANKPEPDWDELHEIEREND